MRNENNRKIALIKYISLALAIVIFLFGAGTMYFFREMYPYRYSEPYDANVISEPLDKVLSEREAKEDIKFFYRCLTGRYPLWIGEKGELAKAVDAEYQRTYASVCGDTTVFEVYKLTQRIAAMLHDGHTHVDHTNTIRYLDVLEEVSLYGKPLRLDGKTLDELRLSIQPYLSYEIISPKVDFIFEHFLRLGGVDTADGVDAVYNTPQGETVVHYDFVAATISSVDNKTSEFVQYEIDKEHSLGIFTLKKCLCNDRYRQVLDAFFAEVFDNQISNIAVDLRNNGGGVAETAYEFIRYLDVYRYKIADMDQRWGWYMKKWRNQIRNNDKKDHTFGGNVYVLTNVGTFSAAMIFAMTIKDNGLGVIVGEASSNLPDMYTYPVFFYMPHSRLKISVSCGKLYRIDESRSGEPLVPDYEVPASEALDKVIERIG